MKILRLFSFLATFFIFINPIVAQMTFDDMTYLTVNKNVTTVVTASEAIKFVDISTDKVAGDQPIDNILRLKPKNGEHNDGALIAVVTILTERYRTQYALLYTSQEIEAVTDKEIEVDERIFFNNPATSMSLEDMCYYARKVWLARPKFKNVSNKQRGLVMRLNNIYSVGDYFFIDFSVRNKTNIRFDIDDLHLKLKDKKTSKATNSQIVELTPSLSLENQTSFLRGYRNVIVVKKLTFPNEKILSIELSEKQISGRTISISIDYQDVLSADGFDKYIN